MMRLPSPHGKIVSRSAANKKTSSHAIPNVQEELFWNRWYEEIKMNLQFPLQTKTWRIDQFFGYFGTRFHPIKQEPNYFHRGIDILEKTGTKIYPIADGILEYAGETVINGTYILIGHPELQTEDGYILHSLYLHLNKTYFSFSTLQKILREIGFKKHTNKRMAKSTAIGEVGATGNAQGIVPHLHLQIELRKKGKLPITLNPTECLGIKTEENLTKNIKSKEGLMTLYEHNKKELEAWRKLWTS